MVKSNEGAVGTNATEKQVEGEGQVGGAGVVDNSYDSYEKGTALLGARYQYVGHLQEGSFGKVTLAVDTVENQKVAVKAMYKSKSKFMADHEINILTRLGYGCSNICQLLGHFETDHFIILILEYCANGDLYDLIHSDTKFSAMEVWNLSKEMSAGMKYAHSRGVFHRDIKPENVLFTHEGTVKLCDWGLSTTRRYNNEFNVGTEKYMAPECFIKREDFNNYDAKFADYWSLGVTVLTAVFGNSPFKPVGESKSLVSDSNFKNFVEYNNPSILYDIFPAMNANCFKIFMHLLKAGGRNSDINNYRQTIRSRNIEVFLKDFEENWSLGLTIDDDYTIEEYVDVKEELFDMDHDDIGPFIGHNSHGYFSESETDNYDDDLDSLNFQNDTSYKPKNEISSATSAGLPSLVDSSINSSKSWCDFEDDDDEFEKIFTRLSMSKNPTKNKGLKKEVVRPGKSNVFPFLGNDLKIQGATDLISLMD